MSRLNRELGYCTRSESEHDKPLSEELEGLIQDLSLKERAFELIHPKKSKAIEKLMRLGAAAVAPLIEAFDHADAEARGWIIYLLGELMESGALLPISRYLNIDEEEMRNREVDTLKNFDSRELKRLIKKAKQLEASHDSEHGETNGANIREVIEEAFLFRN